MGNEKKSSSFGERIRSSLDLNKEEGYTFILNLVTIGGFILYAIGIYMHVVLLGLNWGNIAVDLSIQLFGAYLGLTLIVVLGGFILIFCFHMQKLRVLNVFLCWFWIISFLLLLF